MKYIVKSIVITNNAIALTPRSIEIIFITKYINCKRTITAIFQKIFLKKNLIALIKQTAIFFSSKYITAEYRTAKKLRINETGYKTIAHFKNTT